MSETRIDYVYDMRTGGRILDGEGRPLTSLTHSPAIDGTVRVPIDQQSLDAIRQIIAEEVAKVFPRLPKPDIGIPACPDCGQWVLSEHDWAIPLNNGYRSWWCTCPEKVEAYEARCQQALDDLLQAIHDPKDEIEAILVEMGEADFEELIAKVKASRG